LTEQQKHGFLKLSFSFYIPNKEGPMNQTALTRPISTFPPRSRLKLLYRREATHLKSGDRMSIDMQNGTVSFSRSSEVMRVDTANGMSDDKLLITVPDATLANNMAELIAAVCQLGLKSIQEEGGIIVFEFT
jgi:hypothetical protein